MAGSRYDARKKLVLEEANTVETAYLRSKLLPEPNSAEFQDLFRQYIDVRASVQIDQIEMTQQLIAKSEELHGLLWSNVEALLENNPSSVVTGLFIQSVNEVFDLHGKRVTTAFRNRISISIFITLYFVAFLSMAMMGYYAGLIGARSPIANFALILVLSAVLMLITDLERPSQKIFNVSQQAMVDLKAKISQTP